MPGADPAPGSASVGDGRAARRRGDRLGPRPQRRRPASPPSARTAPSRRRRAAGTRGRGPAARPARGRRAAAPAPAGGGHSGRRGRARPAMIPACGPPSSLSPLNVTSAAPAVDGLARRRLASPATPAVRRRATTGTSASTSPLPRSTTTGTPSVASSPTDVVLDEAVDAVVARMDLQHERDVGARAVDGAAVVGEARAVRRADVDEAGAGLLHHLGHAEPAADLDALAAADRHVPAGGERGERRAARRPRCC